MTQAILQYGMYLVILVVLAIPLGRYMGYVGPDYEAGCKHLYR